MQAQLTVLRNTELMDFSDLIHRPDSKELEDPDDGQSPKTH
jgi:hypothetical protein